MGKRVGLIGFGYIGQYIYERISCHPELGLEVAFVYNRTAEKLGGLPAHLVLKDLRAMVSYQPDLVVEMAHPNITRDYGAMILSSTDYMILSVSVLGEEQLEQELLAVCEAKGTRLYIPHGALVGVDNLFESRHIWEDVTITFRKHPESIDFTHVRMLPGDIIGETVLYDGPVRGITKLYPRNINTMATCALATIGLDRCRGILIANPALDVGIAEVKAKGRDGSRLESYKSVPMRGVSGSEMLESQFNSILKAAGHKPGLNFV